MKTSLSFSTSSHHISPLSATGCPKSVLVYELMSPCPLQAEMSSWLRVVNAAIATASSAPGESEEPVVPSASRGLTRAMTMPPVSQPEGSIVLRSKDGREREREKRFSFFKKNK